MVPNNMKHSPLITALASPVSEMREAVRTAASVWPQCAADSWKLFYLSCVLADPRAGDLPTFPQSMGGCLCRKTNSMNLHEDKS